MDYAEKYALIGAGPMGLAAARALSKHAVPFQGFELNSDVGGLWDIDGPRSTMYETAHLISSKTMTEFDEFPMKDEVAEYPSHRDVLAYFRDFARHFELYQHYRFGAEVLSAVPEGEAWRVTWREGGEEKNALFKGILAANGTLSEPNMPAFEGKFSGELIHASEYRDPRQFADKRVLIIGAGNSGCDIAVDAIHHGKNCDISLRRGYYFVPKYVFGKPADTVGGAIKLPMWLKRPIDKWLLSWFVGDPQRYGFPKPDYKLYESHPIVNSMILFHAGHGDITVRKDVDRFEGDTVWFKDGSNGDYDMVLCATGYKLHYPYLDKGLLNWQRDAPHLYLNCMHPERDDLFVLGMVEASGLGWQGRADQAEMVALYLADLQSSGASALRQRKQAGFERATGGMGYIDLPRMAYYVDKRTYLAKLHSEIKALRGAK
ncbi:NAD(P)-binding domain-containing protein [Lentibacter algarum]|uniref:flavin-containing monooxygenase n=1 Tax=Lentibacter algarum TaxID=576131 RepID=UPI001C06B915|nr:NAD(P)-binding domain-containing protein [Lentibacter algarum]MBU2981829.1 NAD(P)-binding domain-containing protein [Lentibacter algarum]